MSVLQITLAFAAFLLPCLPEHLYARAHAGADKQQLLINLEKRWLASKDNPDALESILADDFIHVLPFGFVTKSEQLRYLRTHPATQHGTTKHFEDFRVRIFDDTGIVNGIVAVTEGDGKVRRTIFTDVFVYRAGRWQAVNAQESPFAPSDHP